MNRDYENLRSAGGKSNLTRNVLILMIVAFIGGAILTGWILSRYNPFDPASETVAVETPAAAEAQAADDPAAALAKRIDADGTVLPAPAQVQESEPEPPILTPDIERALAVRVADLEDRLSRINVQAQAASGNAARAEGLLIAFAARRALDRGSPLGYIESQLRLRFGDAQPKAVTTIINASREPVTLEELASGLDDIGPTLTSGSSGQGFWTDVRRELSELFVIRRDGTPSPAPQQRLLRAERYVENGNVDAAITEIDRLPGDIESNETASAWMEQARRYNEARRALDVIETAAILEPQQLRTAEGLRVEQQSPLAPVEPIPAP
ncbi:inner membrane protein [Parasphingorhabdus marina DSM 22363]|uniref:Inner membrane protein n=1 Tax=Parasphingorhabdus marina DSM 22363 TaxID=1123272 RepID=A0A1N6CZG8_9SPHN|nr:mitofilin family membrane protein [Parasphingorhabdus marina]SIN63951.1 inner membrane protein [Parasphingorhabdus marina DSM 22363]